MATVRLFDEDSYRDDFEARIVESRRVGDKQGLILERTFFYPASGGQPSDRGTLNGVPVVDVFEDGGRIVHVLDGSVPEEGRIDGRIDRGRRFDHMQQHTGQHILSQSFSRTMDAETVGFHLGEEVSTIDLDVERMSGEDIRKTEALANRVVFENRNVVLRQCSMQGLNDIPLRKRPERDGMVRVVEVEDFDWSACCGTHVRRTGEVGLVKVTRWERYKGGTRVTFLCGSRALADYQRKMDVVTGSCRLLTAGEEDVLAALTKWQEERKEATRKLRAVVDEKLNYEAKELWDAAATVGSCRLVVAVYENRDREEVEALVRKLVHRENVVALMGLKREGRGYFYFGRSPSGGLGMKSLMEKACGEIGGRGGGTPEMAQGSGPDGAKVAAVLETMKTLVVQKIS